MTQIQTGSTELQAGGEEEINTMFYSFFRKQKHGVTNTELNAEGGQHLSSCSEQKTSTWASIRTLRLLFFTGVAVQEPSRPLTTDHWPGLARRQRQSEPGGLQSGLQRLKQLKEPVWALFTVTAAPQAAALQDSSQVS